MIRAKKTVNLTEAARLFHKDPSTIRRWADQGMPVEYRGEKLSAWRIDMWDIHLWLLTQDRGERAANAGEVADIEVSRARLAEIRAEKEAIELALLRGDAVSIESIRAAWNDLVVHFRQGMLSIVGKLAGLVAGKTSEVSCRNILDAEIREQLTILSNYPGYDASKGGRAGDAAG